MLQKERITATDFALHGISANIDNNVDYVMLPALTGPDGRSKYHQTEQQRNKRI